MLHFFRKIRRDLLANNKFYKYLKYAIGEIVLVVLGILIALYINNWNEDRKSEERAKLLFSHIQKELLYNIERTNYAIDTYAKNDPDFHSVIKQKVTYNDYESNRPLRQLIVNFDPDVQAQDQAFRLLVENEEAFTPEQDSLVNRLRDLYGLDLLEVKTRYNLIYDMVSDFRLKLKDEKPWYSDLIGGSGYANSLNNAVTEDMISYFLNDPGYLSEVQDIISIGYGNHLQSILGFRTRAIDTYKKIAKYLNQNPDPSLADDIDNFSQYIGSYKNEKGSLSSYDQNWMAVIRKELDKFRLDIYESDSLFRSHEIYPYKKDSYIAVFEIQGENKGILNKFIYDEYTDRIELILLGDYGPKNKERPTFLKIN